MSECATLDVSNVLSEISLTAQAAHAMLGAMASLDDMEVLKIDALIGKIGILANAALVFPGDEYGDASLINVAQTWLGINPTQGVNHV
jgi:hypothetical protein